MKNLIPIGLFLGIVVLVFHFRKPRLIQFYTLASASLWKYSAQLQALPCYCSISRFLGYSFIALGLLILGLKALELQSYGTKILPELVAPVTLSDAGSKALERIQTNTLSADDRCQKELTCKNNQEVANSINTMFLADFLQVKRDDHGVQQGLLDNQLIGFPSAYRGYYVHHYSTILFSYRELKAGNWLSALTNQYGLVSILPLALLEGSPFYYYPLSSILVLMLAVVCASVWIRDPSHLMIFGLLIVLVAFTLLVPGIRIAPGFSIYRLLPTLFITVLLYKNNLNPLHWAAWLGLIVALAINSLQFNLLIYLIYLGSLAIFEVKQIKQFLFNRISLTFVAVIFIQALLYYYVNLDLRFPLFSSVETHRNAIGFGFILMLFPAVLLCSKLRYTWQEIFAYLAYAFLASYTIVFIGSPQHYSNFLLVSLPFVYVLIKNAQIPLLAKFFFPFFFYGIALNMGYFSFPHKTDQSALISNYYKYKPIGKELKFALPNNIDALHAELVDLLKKQQVRDFYFLSKDKIYIEMYNGKNLLPINYDVFAHLNFVKSSRLIKSMKNKQTDFLVMDSPWQQQVTRAYLESAGPVFTLPAEQKAYLRLLDRAGEMTKDFEPFLVACSQRYCLYRIH